MRKSTVFCCVVLFVVVSDVQAIPMLKLPFTGGETWECSQGNYDDPKAPNDTHNNRLAYAWDFNLSGNDDIDRPVIAPAGGIVAYAG
jgi:inner membrane protein involved in colicin E2 resistance